MSRQTDKEEREAAEREAEEKAKAKAKAKDDEAKAKAKDDEAKAKAKEPKPDQITSLSDDVDSAQKPYPHGNPPDPEDEFEKIHGFRRVKP